MSLILKSLICNHSTGVCWIVLTNPQQQHTRLLLRNEDREVWADIEDVKNIRLEDSPAGPVLKLPEKRAQAALEALIEAKEYWNGQNYI
jgi:hypothetical protein